jgi:hypothetical protein
LPGSGVQYSALKGLVIQIQIDEEPHSDMKHNAWHPAYKIKLKLTVPSIQLTLLLLQPIYHIKR